MVFFESVSQTPFDSDEIKWMNSASGPVSDAGRKHYGHLYVPTQHSTIRSLASFAHDRSLGSISEIAQQLAFNEEGNIP
jgi:hypothetical protein